MKGDASNSEREGPVLFLAVRKRHPKDCRPLEDGGAAGKSSVFDKFVPLLLEALPAAFFVASGRSNQEPSRPILTVLPLLRAECLQDGEGGREDWGSRHLEFHLQGLVVFYCSMIALSGKSKWDRATNPLLEMPGGEGWLVGPKQ